MGKLHTNIWKLVIPVIAMGMLMLACSQSTPSPSAIPSEPSGDAPATAVPTLAPPAGMEADTDRTGMDYKDFDLYEPNPELCQSACLADPQCLAYTYVKPGIQGESAHCWLKSGVPPSRTDTCCISGIKPVTPGPASPTAPTTTPSAPEATTEGVPTPAPSVDMEPNRDRPGMDYKDFDLPKPYPKLCQSACLADPQCLAYTYVRPATPDAPAHCWLKSGVPPAKPNRCCISGVKSVTPGPASPTTPTTPSSP